MFLRGQKDRTVPLPQSILPDLQAQLERVRKLPDQDSAAGYAGVFIAGLLYHLMAWNKNGQAVYLERTDHASFPQALQVARERSPFLYALREKETMEVGSFC